MNPLLPVIHHASANPISSITHFTQQAFIPNTTVLSSTQTVRPSQAASSTLRNELCNHLGVGLEVHGAVEVRDRLEQRRQRAKAVGQRRLDERVERLAVVLGDGEHHLLDAVRPAAVVRDVNQSEISSKTKLTSAH